MNDEVKGMDFDAARESAVEAVTYLEGLLYRMRILSARYCMFEGTIHDSIAYINYEKAIDLYYEREY